MYRNIFMYTYMYTACKSMLADSGEAQIASMVRAIHWNGLIHFKSPIFCVIVSSVTFYGSYDTTAIGKRPALITERSEI